MGNPARRIRLARLWALAAAVLASAVAPAALAACRLDGVAAVPVTMAGLRPTVHVTLNGKDAVFLIDSGAFASVISPAAVERYQLPRLGRSGVRIEGVSGPIYAELTQVGYLELGGDSFIDTPFLVVEGAGRDVAGVIGQNILSTADVEYDFANGVMRLIRAKGCGAKDVLSYWTDRPTILPMLTTRPGSGQVEALADINGQKIRVGLDSGTSYSGVTLRAAARAGITPESPDAMPAAAASALGGGLVQSWSAPFDSFAIGSEAVLHTRLRIGATDLGDSDMLLGADFFLAHRIYVSRQQRKVYVTYNGGPVFRLRETPAVAWSFQGSAGGAADPNAPVDAAGFARRGAASVARGDIPHAIDDFGQAIALQPQTPVFYFDRGQAEALDGRTDRALADFDRGLALKPDAPFALIARASVNLDAGRRAAARADLDAAARIKTDDPLLGLELAALYERAEAFAPSIAAYGAWIARNPKDELVAQALGGRCRARALARTELDLARQDCDIAARRRPRDPAVLTGRSLLRLALNETDPAIADADAALRLDPKAAWALYGRGLAKLRKGLKAEGEADLAAADLADPQQAERGRRLGFVP